MTIKELCKKAHKLACEKGFWGKCNILCKEQDTEFCKYQCDDKGYGKRNLSELLMLIVSELGEAQEALRQNNRQSVEYIYKEDKNLNPQFVKKEINKKEWKKDTFEDELCDAVIRICDLAESEGIDLEWQIKQKLKYNKTRPQLHGKKF